jgi:hypothetical protein
MTSRPAHSKQTGDTDSTGLTLKRSSGRSDLEKGQFGISYLSDDEKELSDAITVQPISNSAPENKNFEGENNDASGHRVITRKKHWVSDALKFCLSLKRFLTDNWLFFSLARFCHIL